VGKFVSSLLLILQKRTHLLIPRGLTRGNRLVSPSHSPSPITPRPSRSPTLDTPPPRPYSPVFPSYSPIYPSPSHSYYLSSLSPDSFNRHPDELYPSDDHSIPSYSPTRSRESTLSPTYSEILSQYTFQHYAEE